MSNHLFLISVLYGFSGIVYFAIAIRGILRRNELRIFDLVRLMYSFVYGVIPFVLYWRESNGERNLYFYDYGLSGLTRIYIMWFLSIAVYGLVNLAYYSVRKNSGSDISNISDEPIDVEVFGRKLFICGVISLIIGFITLFLWTSAYGSLGAFIRNAARIRSSRGIIFNRFAFVKQFVRILPLAFYSLLSAFFYVRPKGIKRIGYIVLLVLSIVGNYYYFMASDSRITIIFIGLAILSISIRHRKRKNISRYLIFAAVIGFILLQATMLADSFTHYVRFGEWKSVNEGFINNFTKEFRFIVSSDMKSIKAWLSGDLKIQIGNDLITSLTSWIPDRFVPFEVPDTLWKYNTKMYGTYTGATSPSSLVSTCIYEFGLIGVLIYPLFFGLLIGFTEKFLWSKRSETYADVYYGVLAGLFVQMVSHNQISSFVLALFPAFLFFLISFSVDRLIKKKEKPAEAAPIMPVAPEDDEVEEGYRRYDRYFDDPTGYEPEDDE